MPYELIVTEKPTAAKKIAEALADGKPVKEVYQKVAYYRISHKGKDIIVSCAAGHLFGLTEKKKKGWTYPVFDIEWKPTSEITKSARFTEKYRSALAKAAKKASSFTIATDYDIEGEVIGLNVLRYVCKKEEGNRMKFSTLTKSELIDSYKHKSKTLDWGQARAGETRHILDWFWGINLSRALTLAIKKARGGGFRLLSIGRVQGPALKLVVEKEKEIQAFKPVPFWLLRMLTQKEGAEIEAWHEHGNFWEQEKASIIFEKIRNEKSALVSDMSRNRFEQPAPNPFDLTSLQIEAHKTLGSSPKQTLSTAQNLYINGYISYPRTSSQKLPAKLGFRQILSELSKQKSYSELCRQLLSKKQLVPNEGKKTDDAHPAIYPTGSVPKKLGHAEQKLYDLIVRRFLATFGEPAVRETQKIFFSIKDEIFVAEGTRTVEENWHVFYKPYLRFRDIEFPKIEKGEQLGLNQIENVAKETQPPKRYTESSLIKALEKANLGTKSTRALIIDTLFQRQYANEKPIQATELGIKTIEVLQTYEPLIVDEALTRHFEEEMEDIRHGKRKEKIVIDEAKKNLQAILEDFKKNELKIGKGLSEAEKTAFRTATVLGTCPVCKGELQIKKSRFGFFVGCSGYPKCKSTFGLPHGAKVKPTGKVCSECGYPIVEVQYPRQNKKEVCINPKCPTWRPDYVRKDVVPEEDKKDEDDAKNEDGTKR
jgi:DNA topoisomerase-1